MHGVYKYEVNGEVIYVGKTDRDFAARIAVHSRDAAFAPYLPNAKIYVRETMDAPEADFLETLLINQYRPVLNKAKKMVTDAEVSVNLDWSLWEKEIKRRPRIPGVPKKTRRIQILTYSDLAKWVDSRAKKEKLSRAELFEKVMTEYLDRVGG